MSGDEKLLIPESEWKWFGNAAHFICARNCRFHIATQVGEFIVSTVGELLFDESSRESTATIRGVTLEGRGDARLADYMRKIGYEDIGCDRKFETMAFPAGGPCVDPYCGEGGCGLPPIAGSEIAFDAYNDRKAATEGHMAICRRIAAGKIAEEAADATG